MNVTLQKLVQHQMNLNFEKFIRIGVMNLKNINLPLRVGKSSSRYVDTENSHCYFSIINLFFFLFFKTEMSKQT